ncbi:MAG TPA: isocitrate lyase/PEP mutase family protein [Xanthobacteraceae bacterium]|nr:isocitrate lyase/PEP mutase family protein [Xanthobacteraceae bacterium]
MTNCSAAKPNFRKALEAEQPLILFGAYDALSARLIERAGCAACFISGFSVVGSRFGVPDIGLRAFGDIAAAVRDILQATNLPALVDIDDGYGDVKNAVHTVQSYERMGASALIIEDQTWPKRCGHMAGKSVVPKADMEAKVRAVVGERTNPDTFIIARTDSRAALGLDEALRRAECYLRAGADGLFIEAPESVEEMTVIGRRFDVPLLANPLEGGRSPILTPKEYGELGFGIIGYGITLVLRAATAIQTAIEDTRSGRFGTPQNAMGLEQFKDIVGFADWARIEDKYRPR